MSWWGVPSWSLNSGSFNPSKRQPPSIGRLETLHQFDWFLVGGIPTPLKNMKVSWEYYSQLNGKIKNAPNHQPVYIFPGCPVLMNTQPVFITPSRLDPCHGQWNRYLVAQIFWGFSSNPWYPLVHMENSWKIWMFAWKITSHQSSKRLKPIWVSLSAAPAMIRDGHVAWEVFKEWNIGKPTRIGDANHEISCNLMKIRYWLVVYLPLWKIWLRQLGWWLFPTEWKVIKFMFQTTNQGCHHQLQSDLFGEPSESGNRVTRTAAEMPQAVCGQRV